MRILLEEIVFFGAMNWAAHSQKKRWREEEVVKALFDDVCLFLKNGRTPKSLTPKQRLELKTRIPDSPLDIPPGDTQA